MHQIANFRMRNGAKGLVNLFYPKYNLSLNKPSIFSTDQASTSHSCSLQPLNNKVGKPGNHTQEFVFATINKGGAVVATTTCRLRLSLNSMDGLDLDQICNLRNNFCWEFSVFGPSCPSSPWQLQLNVDKKDGQNYNKKFDGKINLKLATASTTNNALLLTISEMVKIASAQKITKLKKGIWHLLALVHITSLFTNMTSLGRNMVVPQNFRVTWESKDYKHQCPTNQLI